MPPVRSNSDGDTRLAAPDWEGHGDQEFEDLMETIAKTAPVA